MKSNNDDAYFDAKALISSIVFAIQSFHGQDVYSNIGMAVAERNGKAKLVMRIVNIGAVSFFVNFLLIVAIILFLRYFRLPGREGHVFQYGVSYNNKIAFEKLNACLIDLENITIVTNGRPPIWKEKLKAATSFKLLFLSAKILSDRPHHDPFVHIQSAIAVAAFVFFAANPFPASFRVLCVANDHAPIPLALTKLCSKSGLKILYIQHAPVSEYFPALGADLSILYDDKSLEAYRKASKREGKAFHSEIVLMPPFSESFLLPESRGENAIYVGMCLSKFPNLNGLIDFLTALCSCSHVVSVALRPHPACSIDLSSIIVDEKILLQKKELDIGAFTKGLSLALVPTSGVAIELLHKGVPTFFVQGMDDVPYDYYGFISDGVLPVFDVDSFAEEGVDTSFFNEDWTERFSRYDATVKKSIQDYRSEVAEAFARLL